MKGYCENKTICRHKQIVSYFGEEVPWEKCNMTCDNCWPRDNGEDDDDELEQVILLLTCTNCGCHVMHMPVHGTLQVTCMHSWCQRRFRSPLQQLDWPVHLKFQNPLLKGLQR